MIENVLSLFDGMSCGQEALNRAEIPYKRYFASEVDKYAIQVAQKNYPNTVQLGDVTTVKASELPRIDLLMGGSPCQDLSVTKDGGGDGLEGPKSGLFYEFLRIMDETKPRFFLLENVVPRKPEWKALIDHLMGVKGVLINSDLFVGQNRPRYYWTNIPITKLPERPNWNKQYYQLRRSYYRANKSGVCPCLTANMGTGGNNVPLHSMNKADKLTPAELEALQTLPEGYTEGVSNTQRYKMIGNGWTVDVIAHIMRGINA